MIYVSRVRSSLKGGVDVGLGRLTVLYGPNGSGKTSVIQAIELASGGYVSDMEGRDQVKRSTALARLFHPDSRMHAEIDLSDGAVAQWEMKHGEKVGTFKKPVQSGSSIRWPMQEVSDTLSGEGARVKAWLEQEVVGVITEKDILAVLPQHLHAEARRLIRSENKSDFLALGKAARGAARSVRSAATRTEGTIDRMTQGIDTPLLGGEREALEKELSELSALPVGVTQARLDSLKEDILDKTVVCMRLNERYAAIPEQSAEISEVLGKIHGALRLIQMHGDHAGADANCWVCGEGDVAAVQAQGSKLASALEKLKPQHDLAVSKARMKAEIEQAVQVIKAAQKETENAVVYTDNSGRRRDLVQRLANDNAAKQAWDNARASRAEVSAMRKRAVTLTEVACDLEKAGDALLGRRKARFESDVTAFLPEGDELGVDIESARVGLVRSGQLHSALSGAE